MQPIEVITAAIHEADRQRPHLKEINTFAACGELLELALSIAGPEFALVGKTGDMDGSSYRPSWFTPRIMSLLRDDGQRQDANIVGVSQDAAWHIPTKRQYKVIVNSTDGEIANGGSGRPAQLTPYMIDPVKDGQPQYRWHNPPIAQGDAANLPTPVPTSPPRTTMRLPSRDEALDELQYLDRYYASKDGLQREQGLSLAGAPDFLGVAAWYLDIYQNERVNGATREQARAAYVHQIRNSNEWKQKHPGETP